MPRGRFIPKSNRPVMPIGSACPDIEPPVFKRTMLPCPSCGHHYGMHEGEYVWCICGLNVPVETWERMVKEGQHAGNICGVMK